MISSIITKLHLLLGPYFQRKKWRKHNQHNQTQLAFIQDFDFNNIIVGKGSYGILNVEMTRKDAKLIIGNYCSIGKNACFILCSDHCYNTVSTFPYKSIILKDNGDAISKGDIVVDDDVWIGYHAIILSGVHIGQGAIIAAGAVVTSDVPPYAVVGGIPAKIIKYRFSQDIIDVLLSLDYQYLDEDLIKQHIDELYQPIDQVEKKELERVTSWFPKRLVQK